MELSGKKFTAQELAARIDHTVLAPDAGEAQIAAACEKARRYGFRAVFTNSYWCGRVAELLEGSGIQAGVSAAFPLGAMPSAAKVREVMAAVEEVRGRPCCVDMVTAIGLLKDGNYKAYTRDIKAVADELSRSGIELKAILETSLLSDDEIKAACRCAAEAGVNYVKTSTGRSGPPRLGHIRIMRESLPESIGIKYSGFGTQNSAELAAFALALGADLLGSPEGDVLVDQWERVYQRLCINCRF